MQKIQYFLWYRKTDGMVIFVSDKIFMLLIELIY